MMCIGGDAFLLTNIKGFPEDRVLELQGESVGKMGSEEQLQLHETHEQRHQSAKLSHIQTPGTFVSASLRCHLGLNRKD